MSIMHFLSKIFVPGAKRTRLTILIYHRVLEQKDDFMPGETTVTEFSRHLDIVNEFFTVLPLSEAVSLLKRNMLPDYPLAITFDDGYRNNFSNALPVLQSRKMVATFFVATGFIHGGLMWNDAIIESLRRTTVNHLDIEDIGCGEYLLDSVQHRIAAARDIIQRLKYQEPDRRDECVQIVTERCGLRDLPRLMMDENQIRMLYSAGMEIGAHTRSHPILACLSTDEAREEILGSKYDIESVIGGRVDFFAYPNGRPGKDYHADHVRMTRQAGFKAAVTTAYGSASPGSDPFQLPRFTPWDKSRFRFVARLMNNLSRDGEWISLT